MQTGFTDAQLADPLTARSNAILRKCVHCGFCTATCPTYQVLGDELDSPRGRIYLIKDMLENDRPADAATVRHIDRCLTCLACMTTCPSGVDYMHLADHARMHIERTHHRPFLDRVTRAVLARVIPYPGRFRLALMGARLAKPFRGLLPRVIGGMVAFAPARIARPGTGSRAEVFPAEGERRHRVALLAGCAQQALNADINAATVRLLARHGCEVVVAKGAGCCGALTQHMGKARLAEASAADNIRAWTAEVDGEGLDAIVINTSGCGTTVKDYGHMFAGQALAADAARVAALACDITEFMTEIGLGPAESAARMRITYHSACSLQHGQKVKQPPLELLKTAGFEVVEPAEAHLCCGSAGTYNLLQPEISVQLRDRKAANIAATAPQAVAAGNIGCMMQIGAAVDVPVVHTAELLDWATGGPRPPALGTPADARSGPGA